MMVELGTESSLSRACLGCIACLLLTLVTAAGHANAQCPRGVPEFRAAETDASRLVRENPEQGVEARKKLLSCAIQVFGRDSSNVAVAMHNLAFAYRADGQIDKTVEIYKQALDLYSKRLSADDPHIGDTLIALGLSLKDLGQFKPAEDSYTRALEIFKRLGRQDRVEMVLTDLGVLRLNEDKFQEAMNYFQQVLEYRLRVLGEKNWQTANAEHNVADTYWNLSKYEKTEAKRQDDLRKGEEKIRAAISTSDQLGREYTPSFYGTLSLILTAEGRYAEAWEKGVESFKWAESRIGPDVFASDFAANLGVICAYWADCKEDKVQLIDRSQRMARHATSLTLSGLSDRQQMTFLATTQDSFEDALSLALVNTRDRVLAERSAEWLLNGKATIQEALSERTLLLRDSSDPKLLPIINQLREVRRRISNLLYASSGSDVETEKQQLHTLEERESVLSEQLGRAGGERHRTGEWFSLSDVRRKLPADAVLIDIARVRVRDYKAKPGSPGYRDSYVAWLIPSLDRSSVEVVELGDAKQIDADVKKVQNAMLDMQGMFENYGKRSLEVPAQQEKSEEQKFQAASSVVAGKILAPLMPRIRSSKNWIVSPDSNLWAITWAALWISDMKPSHSGHYLLEDGVLVNYVVSSRDLIRTQLNVRTTAPLIMANPDYDLGVAEAHNLGLGFADRRTPGAVRDSERALTPLGRVALLPDTETEAKEVAESLKKVYVGMEPQLLLRKYALAARFKSVHSPKVVYLSTHGFFFPMKNANEGTYQLGSDPLESPLLRCGLAMASCNQRRPQGSDDDSGWLTGMEIVGTDLRGTELVVLSACETGVGDVWAGQSAAGLRQAFELAGAKSVVASLWSVPSAETADLMAGFMDGLASRKPKGQALADSELIHFRQRLEKRGTSHPYYWGAFTLTGDWR